METLAVETKAGAVNEILNCAYPPAGAVSLETCKVMFGLAAQRTFTSARNSSCRQAIQEL
jgi:hypothetical protein